jgi:hypothetical protein
MKKAIAFARVNANWRLTKMMRYVTRTKKPS